MNEPSRDTVDDLFVVLREAGFSPTVVATGGNCESVAVPLTAAGLDGPLVLVAAAVDGWLVDHLCGATAEVYAHPIGQVGEAQFASCLQYIATCSACRVLQEGIFDELEELRADLASHAAWAVSACRYAAHAIRRSGSHDMTSQ